MDLLARKLLRGTGIFLTITFFCCLFTKGAKAQDYSKLDDKVSIQSNITNAAVLVKLLEQQTAYTYIYNSSALAGRSISNTKTAGSTLGSVLRYLHTQAGVDIKISGNIISFYTTETPQITGTISGTVMDEENGEVLNGVTLTFGKESRVSDINGSFTIDLAPGHYTAGISRVGYQEKRIIDIVVKQKQITRLSISLNREKQSLAGVVVTSTMRRESVNALYARQKNNTAITDGISAEQIARTPDNNAAQILKRVNGVTVQDDKFVTVRGLSERYNNVIMNGASLPSTEPNRRNFSFDIVPSGLIDNIVVNKTATPDMPSEFVGGLVQVNTRSIPERNFFSLTAGSGFNTNSTGKDIYSTRRGKKDHLGFDDGTRGWRKELWKTEAEARNLESSDPVKKSGADQKIPNNWGLRAYPYSPVQNYQAAFGRKIGLKNKAASLGITLAATYRHEENIANLGSAFPGYYDYDSSFLFNFTTALGAVANVGFQNKDHKIAFKNLYNRRFNNETTLLYGINVERTVPQMQYVNVTLINTLWQNRLEGEHKIGKKIKFDWSADNISLEREQPDTRSSIGLAAPEGSPNAVAGQYRFYSVNEVTGFMSNGLNIFDASLTEKRKNLNANFTLPLQVKGSTQIFKAGYAGTFRDVDYNSLALRTLKSPAAPNGPYVDSLIFGKADYEFHTPEFFEPGRLRYALVYPGGGTGFSGNDYNGAQDIHAGYLMADLKLLERFRLIGGVRVENSHMHVAGISYDRQTGRRVDSVITYQRTDWLPSANLVYSLNTKMNIRAAYAKTLARAEFRERAPYIYYDFAEAVEYKGAMGLQDAKIDNWDLRYEYYPGPGEVLSLSLFHKKFKDPVEVVGSYSQTATPQFFFFNLESATSTGVEFDMRKSLNFINPASKLLSRIYINGNASWMKANVKFSSAALLYAAGGLPVDTLNISDSRDRPLQGLSPYIINGGIGYFGDIIGVQLSYNKYGRRIVTAGYTEYQDVYENPRDVLDLQLSAHLLKKKMLVQLNISDLLQQDHIQYMNSYVIRDKEDPKATAYNQEHDFVRRRMFKGRNLSLNITYDF